MFGCVPEFRAEEKGGKLAEQRGQILLRQSAAKSGQKSTKVVISRVFEVPMVYQSSTTLVVYSRA
jgi:hypothetical protein